MKPNSILLFLLFLTVPKLYSGTLTAVVVATISLGNLIYDLIELVQEDSESQLATETINSLRSAFEQFEADFDTRLNKHHIAYNLHFFQSNVGFPAHDLFMASHNYLKSRTDFMEQLLLNECLETSPYTRLNNLNTMIAEGWFLDQAKHENFRLPNVESLRIRIFHVMNELVFNHFICMAIQREPVENTVLTEFISSAVANITDTVDKELKTIEDLFFPDFVVKEVYKLIEGMTFRDDEWERRDEIAEMTLKMLRKQYGPGIIVTSQNYPLFNKEYEVQVTKFPTFGKMPSNAIVDIKIRDYYILVTRAHAFGRSADFDADKDFSKIFRDRCDVFLSGSFDEYDVFGVTVFADDWLYQVRIPNHDYFSVSCECFLCGKTSVIITSVPLGLTIDTTPQPSVLKLVEIESNQKIQKNNNIKRACTYHFDINDFQSANRAAIDAITFTKLFSIYRQMETRQKKE
uniref:BTB domain-containing protein n=1 Tax=Panagrellus redivivus TaxID=6233 RepID=A0A7E4W534_PANRE